MLCFQTVHLNISLFVFTQMVTAGKVNTFVFFAGGCFIFEFSPHCGAARGH